MLIWLLHKQKQRANKMKTFTIIDQIALATHNPELFKDKQQLKKVLEIKQSFIDTIYKDYKKEMEKK